MKRSAVMVVERDENRGPAGLAGHEEGRLCVWDCQLLAARRRGGHALLFVVDTVTLLF